MIQHGFDVQGFGFANVLWICARSWVDQLPRRFRWQSFTQDRKFGFGQAEVAAGGIGGDDAEGDAVRRIFGEGDEEGCQEEINGGESLSRVDHPGGTNALCLARVDRA